MPKWRKLHVKAVESLDINDMPDDFTRLLWLLLPLALDREGRGLDNAGWVKSKTMPLRLDVASAMLDTAMDWYETRGMIERYEVGGRHYFWVPSFGNYQGNTFKEAESLYPPPPGLVQSKSGVSPELVQSKSSTDSDSDSDTDTESDIAAESAIADPPAPTELPGSANIPFSEPPEPELEAPPRQNPKKRRKSTADPRTQHPAIQAVFRATGRHPPKVLYDKIIAQVGDSPDPEKMKACYVAWCERGYKPINFAWLFEWALGTGPPERMQNRGDPLAEVDAAIREYARGGT